MEPELWAVSHMHSALVVSFPLCKSVSLISVVPVILRTQEVWLDFLSPSFPSSLSPSLSLSLSVCVSLFVCASAHYFKKQGLPT